MSAGLGCFLDYTMVTLLDQHDGELQARVGDAYISYDDVADLLENPALAGHEYCALQPYASPDNNVAVFQSGYGDSFYATYVGLDEHGQPVKFVIEFIDAAGSFGGTELHGGAPR